MFKLSFYLNLHLFLFSKHETVQFSSWKWGRPQGMARSITSDSPKRDGVHVGETEKKEKKRRKKAEQQWQSAGADSNMRLTFLVKAQPEWMIIQSPDTSCGLRNSWETVCECVWTVNKRPLGVCQSLVDEKWRFTLQCYTGWKEKKENLLWENLGCKQFDVVSTESISDISIMCLKCTLCSINTLICLAHLRHLYILHVSHPCM